LIGGEVDEDETEDEMDEGNEEVGAEEVVRVSVVGVDNWDDVMVGSAGAGVGVANVEDGIGIVEPGVVDGMSNEDGAGEVGPP